MDHAVSVRPSNVQGSHFSFKCVLMACRVVVLIKVADCEKDTGWKLFAIRRQNALRDENRLHDLGYRVCFTRAMMHAETAQMTRRVHYVSVQPQRKATCIPPEVRFSSARVTNATLSFYGNIRFPVLFELCQNHKCDADAYLRN